MTSVFLYSFNNSIMYTETVRQVFGRLLNKVERYGHNTSREKLIHDGFL